MPKNDETEQIKLLQIVKNANLVKFIPGDDFKKAFELECV